jgi:hypothetical protein
VSQRAFSVARCRPGFYAATTGAEGNQGNSSGESLHQILELRFASGAQREDIKLFEHGARPPSWRRQEKKVGGHQVVRTSALLERLVFSSTARTHTDTPSISAAR